MTILFQKEAILFILYGQINILLTREENVVLKQEIQVIIQFKHFSLFDFSQRILKLKYIKQ